MKWCKHLQQPLEIVLYVCFTAITVIWLTAVPDVDAAADSPLTLDYKIENTNLLGSFTKGFWQDLNRLRLDSNLTLEAIPSLSLTMVGDLTALYSSISDTIETDATLYRAYLSYYGEQSLIIIGRQRIPFGVGRVWNPVDIFNPLEATSVEPGEREGTEAFRIEYSPSDLAIIDTTLAKEKVAMRIKGFLEFADMAIVGVYDEENDSAIIGWEIEGELFSTGIELRSEGGIFWDTENSSTAVNTIVGGEYGFSNSLNILIEYLYEESSRDDLGVSLGYQLSVLTRADCLFIINLNDDSTFFSPSLSYSLSDDMTVTLSYFSFSGEPGSEFGFGPDAVFLHWFVHF